MCNKSHVSKLEYFRKIPQFFPSARLQEGQGEPGFFSSFSMLAAKGRTEKEEKKAKLGLLFA